MIAKASLSREEARRIALTAQGLAAPAREGDPSWRKIAATIDRLNLLQIDSVNVLARAHYLPLYSRLGAYDRSLLDAHAFAQGRKGRALFEYWAHEASLLPVSCWPLLQWRMRRAERGDGLYKSLARFAVERRGYIDTVLAEIRANGPLAARELAGEEKRSGAWWGWHDAKYALEWLFWAGLVTASGRRGGFERLYDVPERVLPASALDSPVPAEADAIRALVERSAIALGIASEADLRDYFRLPVAETKRAVQELIESGALREVGVEGWRMQAYLHRDATLPRRATGTALLSPFDPVVWERQRTERLFGFHYRIEIYTPAHKREYGYYVLPFLHEGRFAARLCLKADRANDTLVVNTSHLEDGADLEGTANALIGELRRLSRWLDLAHMRVDARNGLGSAIKSLGA
ncbi:MAG: crosslink repair DNA glycosylase YcaQ family protein [Hyphomicrobiales bacterium]